VTRRPSRRSSGGGEGEPSGRLVGAIPQDSAAGSLEVVHDQRPPTPFHAQNLQFQPPPTTANDTWGVRALLRRLILTPSTSKQRSAALMRVADLGYGADLNLWYDPGVVPA
jgi:hypothetical protein